MRPPEAAVSKDLHAGRRDADPVDVVPVRIEPARGDVDLYALDTVSARSEPDRNRASAAGSFKTVSIGGSYGRRQCLRRFPVAAIRRGSIPPFLLISLAVMGSPAQQRSAWSDRDSIAPGSDPLSQVTRLPRPTRLFLAGNTVSMVGNGLVLPFLLIYLHQVRGIALPVVGALLAGAAIAGLVVVPISGALIDRLGARPVLAAMMLGQAIAEVLFALAHSVETALPAVLLYGSVWVPMLSTRQTMIAGLTPDPVMQQRAFAINFTAQNAAIGIGAAVAAAVVGAGAQNPTSFEALFLANAASCLLFVGVLPFIQNPHPRRQRSEPKAGYRDVLAHPGLRLVIVASLLLAFVGYPAFDSGLPAFSTVVAHVPIRVVALSLTVNTVFIVATQLLVLRLVRRLRRSVAVTLIGVIWAASWAVLGLSAVPTLPAARIACVLAFTALFGLGETFFAPTIGSLLNSLAHDRIRGRANSVSGFSFSLGFIASPAIVTGFIATGTAAMWIVLLCLFCFGTIGIGVTLGRQLTSEQDHVGAHA